MRLLRITLQDFRNVAATDLRLEGRQQFFLGPNAQGKTNLLEAVGFLTALRSFRTAENRVLIGQGRPEAVIACELDHERLGETRVAIKLRSGSKEVWCDGAQVTRFGDFLGRFPTVVFSSQDQQLLRGAPGLRRRWLDLTLASVDAGYMRALQAYHRALVSRNSLLKRGQLPAEELNAFEQPLAEAAAVLVRARRENLAGLAAGVAAAYATLSGSAEPAGIDYAPHTEEGDGEAWRRVFHSGRARDAQFRTTLQGPHRDDVVFTVAGRAARDYGSEGQQRSLVLALRLAQLAFFRERCGVEPILLADDVLGELDPERRRRFWASLGNTRQVIATGTSLPEAELGDWQVFTVRSGGFAEKAATG